jgi:hypothetical protein
VHALQQLPQQLVFDVAVRTVDPSGCCLQHGLGFRLLLLHGGERETLQRNCHLLLCLVVWSSGRPLAQPEYLRLLMDHDGAELAMLLGLQRKNAADGDLIKLNWCEARMNG